LIFSRLYNIHECERHTDGQTDTAWRLRGKNSRKKMINYQVCLRREVFPYLNSQSVC